MSSPISGFTAVPNPIMLPFMAMQSYFMMLLAGEAWQFGKRKISAMTNEEFNKLDIQTHLSNLITSMEKAIPSIESSMRDFTPLARTITAEMVKTLPEIAKGFGEGIGSIFNQSGTSFGAPITNVRLSQGSQQFQRDRELYAGGAPSLYEQDIQRDLVRKAFQKAEQDARLAQSLKQEALARVSKSAVASFAPTIGRRVSNQTLKLSRTKLIREIQALANQMKNTPRTIRVRKTKIIRATGSAFGRARPRVVTVTVVNPKLQSLANQIKTKQSRLKQVILALKR